MSDLEENNKGRKKQERARQERMEAWQFVMSSRSGRMVIRDILRMSGINASPFTGATNQTIKNIGMQDLGRLVQTAAREFAFDNYMTLLHEDEQDG